MCETRLTFSDCTLEEWMERHDFNSVDEMRGEASLKRAVDPAAAERAAYIRTLHSWEQEGTWQLH